MKFLKSYKLFESSENKIYYHATDYKYIDSILKDGLDTNIGIKRWINNDYPLGTYLFDDYDVALKYAILNCEDGEVLEINSKGLTILDDPEDKIGSHFEDDKAFYTTDKIPVSSIKLLNISDEEKDEIYRLYESFGSSESLEDIKDYIDDILLPLEETNYVRVIDYTRYKKIDDFQPEIDINHIKIDIACDLEQENAFMGNDDFKLTEDNLSDIKSLYNYMVDSVEWDCKYIKSKYYSLREGTFKDDYRQLSKEFKDINEFEEWYKTNCENGEDLLKGITLFFSEYSYID